MDAVEYSSVIKFYLLLNKSNNDDLQCAYKENWTFQIYYISVDIWIQERKAVSTPGFLNVGRPVEISNEKISKCEALIRHYRRI